VNEPLDPKDFYPQFICDSCGRVVHWVKPQLCDGLGDWCLDCNLRMRRIREQDR